MYIGAGVRRRSAQGHALKTLIYLSRKSLSRVKIGIRFTREVPTPLTADIARGDCPIETVLSDLMALTKLNFSGATFSDGLPVTLRFADLVGEILTAGPNAETAPLPFKFYI